MAIVQPTPPAGYWTYWINGCQLFVPNGHTVSTYNFQNNGYTVTLFDSTGQPYQHWMLSGATTSTVVYVPPTVMPHRLPVNDASQLRDDELILTLI
jgi:hypothetical protein